MTIIQLMGVEGFLLTEASENEIVGRMRKAKIEGDSFIRLPITISVPMDGGVIDTVSYQNIMIDKIIMFY